jgi:hypothetical protein
MSVSSECCVLSGRGLCEGPVTRPQEPCRVWCVSECDREATIIRWPCHTGGCSATEFAKFLVYSVSIKWKYKLRFRAAAPPPQNNIKEVVYISVRPVTT